MKTICWVLIEKTPETMFISSLFYLLLTGLTFVILLHQLRAARGTAAVSRDWFLPAGFLLLILHFSLPTAYFGISFFFPLALPFGEIERVCHVLFNCSLLLIGGSYVKAYSQRQASLVRWIPGGCAMVAGVMLLDIAFASLRMSSRMSPPGRSHSPAMLFADLMGLLAVSVGIRAVLRAKGRVPRSNLVALTCLGAAFFLHTLRPLFPQMTEFFVWNTRGLLSVALFTFSWAVGERSRNLLDRVFVRLNLAFIILASLLMLVIAGMEKRHYLQGAEERSKNLTQFLRAQTLDENQGKEMGEIVRNPEVLQRVIAEAKNLPELREIQVDLDGRRATLRRTSEGTITAEVTAWPEGGPPEPDAESPDTFRMIQADLGDRGDRPGGRNQIQFLGTTEYLRQYMGKYIAVIYASFTLMVVLASSIIGLIVAGADRQLRRQYAELEKSHQELAQAAKLAAIGQLAAGVAHEINNPITSVLSLASHLTEGKGGATLDPRHRASLRLMAQQAERVAKIVQNLLTFARKSQLEMSRVNVRELLDTATALAEYRLKNTPIRLRYEMETGLPHILGDPGRLTEVLINLLNNAIDAMPGEGTILVRALASENGNGGGVRLEVVDTGCGIQPEELPRIFDPFFTTKEPGRGTGLGLSISHGIVRDHGGRIWVESRPGVGTTVVIDLPKEVSQHEIVDPGD